MIRVLVLPRPGPTGEFTVRCSGLSTCSGTRGSQPEQQVGSYLNGATGYRVGVGLDVARAQKCRSSFIYALLPLMAFSSTSLYLVLASSDRYFKTVGARLRRPSDNAIMDPILTHGRQRKLDTYKTRVAFAGMCPGKPLDERSATVPSVSNLVEGRLPIETTRVVKPANLRAT